MQILGKRSKVLVMAISIIMLITVGVSFAVWDTSAVKATSGNSSTYANAKVGDVIEFGRYYQTGEKVSDAEDAEYKKTPIEWIVVDKDERTGQFTLMSKYILAAGSYFGNYYYNNAATPSWGAHYDSDLTVAGIPYNQAYVDSTARAFLNNLERLDMGGDSFDATKGYIPSAIYSTYDKTTDGIFTQGSGLLSSAGFSNQRYWTKLNSTTAGVSDLIADPKTGLFKRYEASSTEVYYQRPISNEEYKARPATKGFIDEAFDDTEKSMIVPKTISGYTGHRWPNNTYDITTKSYVEGAVDKVWLPSATELNVANGLPWNYDPNNQETYDDAWTNPSDEAGSTVFEYFKNYNKYKNPFADRVNTSVSDAVKAVRTIFAQNSFAMNYSIPVYKKGTTEVNADIHPTDNSNDYYWTRSPSSYWYANARVVNNLGLFNAWGCHRSYVGVRPCIILKY